MKAVGARFPCWSMGLVVREQRLNLWELEKDGNVQLFAWGREQIGPFTKDPLAIGRMQTQPRKKLEIEVALVLFGAHFCWPLVISL